MRVFFDISTMDHEHISGVGIYIAQLAMQLKSMSEVDLQPVWKLSRWRRVKWYRKHLPAQTSRPYVPWLLNWRLQVKDVFHGPDFRLPEISEAAKVVTVHDLAFLRQGLTSPEFASKKKADLDRVLKKAKPDAIIVVSDATRRDLIQYAPEYAKRIHVVSPGADHLRVNHLRADHLKAEHVNSASLVTPAVRLRPYPFFLFVGNLEARKNVLGILKGFERFAARFDRGGRYHLILVGKLGYDGERVLKAIEAHPVKSRIHHEGYLPNQQLTGLYQEAVCLTYPSWVEGFGTPVLEAMSLGCPVITSSVTATAEVAGTAAALVDPGKIEDIAIAMNRMTEDKAWRDDLIHKGRFRSQAYVWSDCARKTINVYQWALSNRNS